MTFGDNPGRSEKLQSEGQPQALQKITRASADTYASMFNAALFPFLLYQQSLTMATRVALGSLRAATGVVQQGGMLGSSRPTRLSDEAAEGATRGNMQPAQQSTTMDVATDQTLQQGIEVGDETAWQDMEVINRAAQDKMRAASRAALQQNAGATEETTRESYAEMADRSLTEVDEVASDPAKPVPTPSPEAPNAMGELPPSPSAEATARPVAEAVVDATNEGSPETSNGAERAAGDEATAPSASVPTVQEESVLAEGASPTREESPTGEGTNTIEELPPPPEVSEVDLPPPPPVPQNILDELPPPPALETLDEPTAQSARGEKPRIHVSKVTAAARRTAEELNVNLDEVEGSGRDGQITLGDVHKKAAERKS